MQDYVTRAVVLDKAMRNDADARYSFFTERYGKIAAKATSSRKIVSKLAGHLEPGTLAAVRIIETHGARVVDALASSRVAISIADLAALNNLLPEWQPDAELWQELALEKFSWSRTLAILGWDPRGAVCANCNVGSRPARHFYLPRQEFFCVSCASSFMSGGRTSSRTSMFASNQLLLVDE